MSQDSDRADSSSWDSQRLCTYRHNGTVVLREIAGEMLLVPVRGRLAQLQRLFVLNPVAHFIWQTVDGETNLETIHGALLDTFEVDADEARSDLLEFVEGMREADLLVDVAADMGESP